MPPAKSNEFDRPTNEVSWLLLPLNAPDPLKPRLASFSFIRPICKEGIVDFGWISMRATVLESRLLKISFVLNLFLPDEIAKAISNLLLPLNLEPKVVPVALKFNHGLLN